MNKADKLRLCATIVSIVTLVAAFISGISLLAVGDGNTIIGFVVMVMGVLSAILLNLACGCIADIYDKTDKNAKYLEYLYHKASEEEEK